MKPGASILLLLLALPLAAVEPDPIPYQERQKQLEEILSRKEFHAEERRLERPKAPTLPEWTDRRIEELRGWLRKVRDWIQGKEKDRPDDPAPWKHTGALAALPQATAWTLGGLGLVLLAVLAWRILRSPGTASAAPAGGGAGAAAMPDALSRPPEAWRLAAEAHAAKGEWRLALRACYLALLNELHLRRAIRYSRERTNGEYVSALASHPAGESFARLTLAFDSAWYGTLAFGEWEYREAVSLVEAVDRATAPVEAAV